MHLLRYAAIARDSYTKRCSSKILQDRESSELCVLTAYPCDHRLPTLAWSFSRSVLLLPIVAAGLAFSELHNGYLARYADLRQRPHLIRSQPLRRVGYLDRGPPLFHFKLTAREGHLFDSRFHGAIDQVKCSTVTNRWRRSGDNNPTKYLRLCGLLSIIGQSIAA